MSDSGSQDQSREQLTANDIISKTFSIQRRGFRTEEVSRFLAQVAGLLADKNNVIEKLIQSRDVLEVELGSLKSRRDLAKLDAATVSSILGEEAAGVLRSATEAADAIRKRAETYSSELTAQVDSEVRRLHEETEAELTRISDEHRADLEREAFEVADRIAAELGAANAEADAILDRARSEAAEMVAKSKAIRAQVYDEIRNRTVRLRADLLSLQERRDNLAALLNSALTAVGGLTAELARGESPLANDTEAGLLLGADHNDGGALFAADGAYGAASEPDLAANATTGVEAKGSNADSAIFLPEPGADSSTGIAAGASSEVRDVSSAEAESSESRTLYVFDDLEGEVVTALPSEGSLGAIEGSFDEGGGVVSPPLQALDAGGNDPALAPELVGDALSNAAPSTDSVPGESSIRGDRQSSVQGIFARLLSDVEDPSRSDAGPTEQPATRENDGGGDGPGGSDESEPELNQGVAQESAEEVGESVEEDAVADASDALDEQEPGYDVHREFELRFSPIQAQVGRRIKRALQDDQNELLDRLRTSRERGVVELIGPADHLSSRYLEVLAAFVPIAADASRALYQGYAEAVAGDANVLGVSVEPSEEMFANARELAGELATELTGRIERVLMGDVSEDDSSLASEFGAAFRELKTDYVELLTKDLVSSLVSGWLLSCSDVTAVHWLRSPRPGCSDCEDNELARKVRRGEEFPTGAIGPPAHIGCECLLVPDFA